MKKQYLPSFFLLLIGILFNIFSPMSNAQPQEPAVENGYYVFCYFVNNGEDGVHYAVSRDGYKWNALNKGEAIFVPQVGKKIKLTRDPSITCGKDGIYHMVWTVAWDGRSFGHAWSKDLITWNDPTVIPCMQDEPTTRNTWAPEVFYYKDTETYYIIWSSTIPGKFSPAQDGTSEDHYDHRVYYTKTKDFLTFAPTQLYFDPGHNTIDAFLAEKDGVYYLFYKDESLRPKVKKTILVSTSNNPEGPFSYEKEISPRPWVEGPSALLIKDKWVVYFDCYTAGKYGAVCSSDGENWKNIEELISFPQGTRHGTAFEIDQKTYNNLVTRFGISE